MIEWKSDNKVFEVSSEMMIAWLQVYHELGGKEVDDQVAVSRYLRDNLHFVDPRRITIWGWSYGGYVTTMALARDADDVFSCGVAVAPVARWEHYGKATPTILLHTYFLYATCPATHMYS